MADQGTLSRDPNWTPPQAAPADGSTTIRNPIAYQTAATASQARVSDAIASVRDHPTLGDDDKATIGTALATLGTTSDRAAADQLVADTLRKLPKGKQAAALTYLSPITAQIKGQ